MFESQVQLKIGNTLYGGWKSLRAEVGIEQCSGAFELQVTDKWSGQSVPWQIKPGDACQLLLADQKVITGYVDRPRPHYNKKTHGIRVSGRDKTMDLIDCSAIYKSGQWKNATLDRIANDICTPFGIDVVADGDMGAPFDSFNIEVGERAFECIDRAARMRGVLVTTDGNGKLLLTRASSVKSEAALIEGDNIYDADLDMSWKERYSSITVKGQGRGSIDDFGAAVAHGSASVTDDAITRYRPLIVIAEQHGKGPTFQQRAEWERNVRRGRGTRAVIQVQGWTYPSKSMPNGFAVWKPNMLVPVHSPYIGISEDLLIAKCSYSLDETGSFTHLHMVHRSAFDILDGIKGTKLNAKITGVNGLEDSRRHAKNKAKGGTGVTIDMQTGTPGDGQ